MKEHFAPDEHREIASFNTNNEFNRAINEEDIDFNIPGLPHSAVKRSHGASVRDLIQKIENHPHRHALQRYLQPRQQFNPFSQESKDVIREVGNIELCELLDVNPKHSAKYVYHTGTSASSTARAGTSCETERRRTRKLFNTPWISSRFSQLLHQERATPRASFREEARGSRILHREFAQEEMQEERILEYPRPVHPR